MKKLVYNIYSEKLNDEEVLGIKSKLSALEVQMSDILLPIGWKITLPIRASDALAIDFTTKSQSHYGNIGLKFDNEAEGKVFSLYLTKSLDVGNVRYFLSQDVFTNKPLNLFEKNIDLFLLEALNKYNNWTDADIMEMGEKFD